jgi:hypothetical protein
MPTARATRAWPNSWSTVQAKKAKAAPRPMAHAEHKNPATSGFLRYLFVLLSDVLCTAVRQNTLLPVIRVPRNR